jgi:hypothetical protein
MKTQSIELNTRLFLLLVFMFVAGGVFVLFFFGDDDNGGGFDRAIIPPLPTPPNRLEMYAN